MTTHRLAGAEVTLQVQDEGEGPAILLLHGFPDTSALWRHQIAALTAAGYRTIAPDLRGFGGSDKPDSVGAYGLTTHVADAVAVLDGLGIERAHVVGHDWGAAIAWFFAMMAPDRTDHLVTLSVGRPGTRERRLSEHARSWYMYAFQAPEAEDWLTRNGWRNFRAFAKTWADVEEGVERLGAPGALTASLAIYRANVPPAIMLSEPFDLPPIAAPTMGLWSTGDFALSEEQMTDSASQVTGPWRYERIEGASHWIPLDAPDRLNELLLDFLPSP